MKRAEAPFFFVCAIETDGQSDEVHLHVTEVRPVHRRRRDQLLFIKCAQFVVGVVVLNGSGSGRAVRQRVRRWRRRLGRRPTARPPAGATGRRVYGRADRPIETNISTATRSGCALEPATALPLGDALSATFCFRRCKLPHHHSRQVSTSAHRDRRRS